MPSEKLGLEDCDLNSIFKAVDKDTQTIEANKVKSSECSVKSYKLPLPRELDHREEGQLKVFSFCQIIQDPACPKSVTIVRESVTEEVHKHKTQSPSDEAFSNRYRYCKEVIKPYLRDYPPDCPDSEELLLRDAITTANEEFPEYPPCFEVPNPTGDSQKPSDDTTKQEGKLTPPPISDKPKEKPSKDPPLIPCDKKSSPEVSRKDKSKELPPTLNCKDRPPKDSCKDLSPKDPCKDLPSKESSKDQPPKVSDKLPSNKSSKELNGKKSSKSISSKKSDRDLSAKKSNKDCSDKSAIKSQKKPKSDDSEQKSNFVLCQNKKEPKICIQITDLNSCPRECFESDCQDDCSKRKKTGRKSKQNKEEGHSSDKCNKKSDHGRWICHKEDSKEDDYRPKPKKPSGKGTCENNQGSEKPYTKKSKHYSDRDDTDCTCTQEDCGGGKDIKKSTFYCDRETCEARRPKEGFCAEKPRKPRKAEPIPCSENLDHPRAESYYPEKTTKPCPLLPPRPPKEDPPSEKPPKGGKLPKETFSRHKSRNESSSADQDDCPAENDKECVKCRCEDKDKSGKSGWPQNTEHCPDIVQPVVHDPQECLTKLLDSLQFKQDDKTCRHEPPLPKNMANCPSENPPPKLERASNVKNGISATKCSKKKSKEELNKKKSNGKVCVRKKPQKEEECCTCEKENECDESSKGEVIVVTKELPPPPPPPLPPANMDPCRLPDGSNVKSAMDAHMETLGVLKCAMEDFMCKVFKSTQNAVAVIKTESVKQFEKLRKSESNTDCPPPKKVDNHGSRQNLRRFSLVNVDNLPKKLPPCVPPPDAQGSGPLYYFEKLADKVDSAMSIISDSLAFEIPKKMKPKTFNDTSSKYDIPMPSRPMPKDVEYIVNPLAGPSTMLHSIKDKIMSIFCDDDKSERELSTRQSTSSTSTTSESDEDLMNKLID